MTSSAWRPPKEQQGDWFEVGRTLADDADAQLSCPNCREATLEATWVPGDESSSSLAIVCPICGANIQLRLGRGRL